MAINTVIVPNKPDKLKKLTGPYQRTWDINDTKVAEDASPHVVVYLNPLQPVTVRRVWMVLRKAITADLQVRLRYKGPVDATIWTIGTFTTPAATAINTPVIFTSFGKADLIDGGVIWGDITASDGSKDVNSIATLTIEYIARGADQVTADGLIFQGPFDPAANYAKGDLVSFNGSTFVSLVDNNVGTTPGTDPTKWALVAAAGASGGATGGATGAGAGSSPGTFVEAPSGILSFDTGIPFPGQLASASFGIVQIPALTFAA